MGRLTIDIPDGAHQSLKVIAATHGVSIKDYVLEKLLPELGASASPSPSLREMASAWEERRAGFKLDRGKQSLREITHAGHKW